MEIILTIAIPTYNRRDFLKRALESILCQMDSRVEIIVSDNASNDGTEDMMKQDYPLIKYYRNTTNIGFGGNFLNCCKLANGRFFVLLGSDDIVIEGALIKIINFLEMHPECTAAFMNHVFFQGEYIDLNNCIEKWRDKFESFVTNDKKKFIEIACDRISFMSCLIFSREKFLNIDNPNRFIGRSFLHSNLFFEMTKNSNDILGVIGDYCIADNITYGDATVVKSNLGWFNVFGKELESLLCTHATKCGYAPKTMKKIYINYAKHAYPRLIIKIKAKNEYNWRAEYKETVRPILKKYPILWFYSAPFYLVPNWLAKFIRNYIRPIYKKIRSTSRK